MKSAKLVLLSACALLLLTLGGTAMAQDQKMTPEQMAAMQESMKYMMPGEGHKHLEYFVGKWNTNTKVWPAGPGSTPLESPGTSEIKWVVGNHFLMEEHNGTMMGMPYQGMGFTGFDAWRNMYATCWVSNMQTNLLTLTGQRDPSGKFTYYGEMDEPSLKVTGRMIKSVTTIKSPDQYVFEVFDLHAGDNYKVFEITYTRVK